MTQFCYYHFGNHVLVENAEKPILTQVHRTSGSFEAMNVFAPLEYAHIQAILSHYPECCPDEVHLSIARGKSDTYWQQVIWQLRSRNESMTGLMGPVFDMISAVRSKLTAFSLTIARIDHYGYQFVLKKEERTSSIHVA